MPGRGRIEQSPDRSTTAQLDANNDDNDRHTQGSD